MEVCCFSNCEYVELFVNGKAVPGLQNYLQRGSSFPCLNWQVPFEKGEVVAIGRNNGVEVCRQVLRTPEKVACLRLSADRRVIRADGEDLSFIRIDLLDENGTFVADGREKLRVRVTGCGRLKGLCSGDPASHEKESSQEMFTFSGSLLAIIQSGDEAGTVSVSVTGDNVKSAVLEIRVE